MKVLIYDTETGGTDHEKHSIFSVGALVGDLKTGEIIDMFEAYHKLDSVDDYVYSPKAVEIHGITPEEAFEKGISTSEICDKFSDLWYNNNPALIGGHNEIFDRLFMAEQMFQITKTEFESTFTYRSVDSLTVLRLFFGHDNVPSGASLTQAIKAFKINMDEYGKNKFHAALFDSIACFKLLHRFYTAFQTPEFIETLKNG